MPKVPFWVFIIIALIYLSAVRVDTMDVDASQYAEISREMMVSGDYLHVFDRGIDYLDKPPLLFWLSAGSMKVFGVNNFGYKLPSILFALWALFATYKLGKRLYGDTTGRMAALILACCQGMFLMTNDVRCDTILLSCVITSLWLIQEWLYNRKIAWLLGGAAAIAFGMMTKGPIAAMVPVFCFATDWALKRQWKNFLQPAYLLAIIVIAVLLIPMSVGLYQQFDLHPEKLVNGGKGASGLRFFYWAQSFGRITGESPWNNGAKIDFLMLNMLWSFLPWIFIFIAALIINTGTVIRQKFRLTPDQEWVTTGGFLLAYLALGSSAYQLPHYIFVVFPLAAIMTARLLFRMIEEHRFQKMLRIMQPAHTVIALLLVLAVLLLSAYVFDGGPITIISWCLCTMIWVYMAISKKLKGKLLWLPAAGMIIVNIFLTNSFYHTLLNYQIGSQAGRYIVAHNIKPTDVGIFKVSDPLNAVQFYANGRVRGMDTLTQLDKIQYLYTMKDGMAELTANGYKYTVNDSGVFYKVSELTLPFLNPATRSKEVKKYYFIKLL